jgi:glycolate oxidase FAD binding subunit
MKTAAADQKTIRVIGADTKHDLGRPLSTDLTCDLSGLSGITLLEPEELVMTAMAGTPVAEIEAALAKVGVQLAFEPLDLGPTYGHPPGKQTIGGVIACNLSGPRRVSAGAARDHFLGLEAVTGHGEIIKAGGRVVKNVTGYDLCKLFAGSYGTLGVLTQVTLKVMPLAQRGVTVIVKGLDDATANALLRKVVTQPLEVSGAAHLPAWAVIESELPEFDGLETSVTAIRLEGFSVSVENRIARLRKQLAGHGDIAILDDDACKRFWADLRMVGPAARRPDFYLWRLSVPPAQGAQAVATIQRSLRMDVYYDWSGGLIWALVPALGGANDKIVRHCAEAVGGHAILMRAPDAFRSGTPAFHPLSDGKAALVARIKESFDPKGILNPGRMYWGV